MLQLRDYQERSLNALEQYLSAVAEHGAQRAFVLTTNRPYQPAPSLPGLPYVCLRVPTGGGKTIMAAYAVGIAARAYLHTERPVCLWLVPSNAIHEQTLKALRDRAHPYRQALDVRFSGNVRVMDLAEALYVQRATLEGDTTVIVSTLQALRRDDTEGLKVYEPAIRACRRRSRASSCGGLYMAGAGGGASGGGLGGRLGFEDSAQPT